MINNSNNQDWNSTLLLWHKLTHYGNISDILDKITIDYRCLQVVNKFIKL